MNARNFLYIRPIIKRQPNVALMINWQQKNTLTHGHPDTSLLATFYDRGDVRNFDWNLPSEGFALKPARGYVVCILAFKSWHGDYGVTMSDQIYTVRQLSSHVFDMLDGAFSLQYYLIKHYRRIDHSSSFFQKIRSN